MIPSDWFTRLGDDLARERTTIIKILINEMWFIQHHLLPRQFASVYFQKRARMFKHTHSNGRGQSHNAWARDIKCYRADKLSRAPLICILMSNNDDRTQISKVIPFLEYSTQHRRINFKMAPGDSVCIFGDCNSFWEGWECGDQGLFALTLLR